MDINEVREEFERTAEQFQSVASTMTWNGVPTEAAQEITKLGHQLVKAGDALMQYFTELNERIPKND